MSQSFVCFLRIFANMIANAVLNETNIISSPKIQIFSWSLFNKIKPL